MKRRLIFTTTFLMFIGAVMWFASGYVRIPYMTFQEASKVGDHKKKVMVPGKVLQREIAPDGSTVTFFMVDDAGTESKVFYDGSDALTPGQLNDAASKSKTISVAGHVCGERFHASSVFFPAY